MNADGISTQKLTCCRASARRRPPSPRRACRAQRLERLEDADRRLAHEEASTTTTNADGDQDHRVPKEQLPQGLRPTAVVLRRPSAVAGKCGRRGVGSEPGDGSAAATAAKGMAGSARRHRARRLAVTTPGRRRRWDSRKRFTITEVASRAAQVRDHNSDCDARAKILVRAVPWRSPSSTSHRRGASCGHRRTRRARGCTRRAAPSPSARRTARWRWRP